MNPWIGSCLGSNKQSPATRRHGQIHVCDVLSLFLTSAQVSYDELLPSSVFFVVVLTQALTMHPSLASVSNLPSPSLGY